MLGTDWNGKYRAKGELVMRRKRAFTLVELFVVFAAVILLASVLVPVLRESRSAARIASCKSHQKKVSRAIFAYTEDYDGGFPYNRTYDFNWNTLDWALRVGRVADEDVPYIFRDEEPEHTICTTGYVDYNYASSEEGVFKCPAFIDQVEPRATYVGACSSQFSINENVCNTFGQWDEVVVTRIDEVRANAVMIGDGNLKPAAGIDVASQFSTASDGGLRQGPDGLYPYDFGPWTHQEHVAAWTQTMPCDFYGHTKEKAILTYVSGHTKAVRKIVHEEWMIEEPPSE